MKKEELLEEILNNKNLNNISKLNIYKAYLIANELHKNQYRLSKEEYIIHPLNVALIISKLGGDEATIISSLLHDTLEDTNLTKSEIKDLFGEEVSEIVDGVTKLNKINFLTKEEKNLSNRKKLVNATIKDVRVIILKLADRLHNMRTMDFKSYEKQVENSKETLEFFVPFAIDLGLIELATELQNLSYKYLNPNMKVTNLNINNNSWESLLNNEGSLIRKLKTLDINNIYIPQKIEKLI